MRRREEAQRDLEAKVGPWVVPRRRVQSAHHRGDDLARLQHWALEDEARFANDVRKREAARRKREEQKAKAAAAAPADAPMEEAAATGAADAMEE